MNRKYIASIVFVFCLLSNSRASIAQAVAGGVTNASAAMQPDNKTIQPGSEIVMKIKLNEPLPKGAHFDVRLSPVSADQQIPVPSGEPTNSDRTEFTLKTTLPEELTPGIWHISVIYLFLPGTSWTTSTIKVNDLQFRVDGPKFALPTSATATITTTPK